MIQLFQTLDALLYDIILWIVLTPKTFLKTLIAPKWVRRYVYSELEKRREERYESYMPPITFFVIVGILPFTVLGRLDRLTHRNILSTLPLESETLAWALMWLSAPLVSSVIISRGKRLPISRTSLRPIFHAQSLLWAVFLFVTWFSTYFLERLGNSHMFSGTLGAPIIRFANPVAFLFMLCWYLYAESHVISEELHITRLNAVVVGFLCVLTSMFVSGLIVRMVIWIGLS
jgi:hypothetical protein